MITIYSPLPKEWVKSILLDSISDFSSKILSIKLFTGRDFKDILIDGIEDVIQRDPTFHSKGLVMYVKTTLNMITAIDFSKFDGANQICYISYTTDNLPKIIKDLQNSR